MAMQTGASGFTGEFGSGFMKGRFRWSESYDIDTNTSNVTVYPQFKTTNWYGFTYYLSGSYTVDGTTVASMSSSQGGYGIYTSSQNNWLAPTIGPTSFTKNGIAHNADGTRSITLQFSVRGYTVSGSGGGSGWSVSGSATIQLTSIPRGSTVSGTDANIGAVSTLVVHQNVAGTTHSIRYVFGALSGYVTAAGGVSQTEQRFAETIVNWTVPESFYGQIPNATSGRCTLTITTYQASGAQLGNPASSQLTATTTAALSGPLVSGTVEDVNPATTALTGDSARLVAGYSTARASITAGARNGAAITSRSINGTAVDGDGHIDYAGNTAPSFLFAAADSRGFTAQVTVTPDVVSYIPLTVNGTCERTAPTADTAALTLSGNWFSGTFGARENALAVRYTVDEGEPVDLAPKLSDDTWSASADLSGVAYTSSFTITVTAEDRLTRVTRTIILNRGIPAFDWGADSFRFNVPLVGADGAAPPRLGTASVGGEGLPIFLNEGVPAPVTPAAARAGLGITPDNIGAVRPYMAGDSLHAYGGHICAAGFITSGNTGLYMMIPVDRPVVASQAVLRRLWAWARSNGGYIFPAAGGGPADFVSGANSVTATLCPGSGVFICLMRSASWGGTNNHPVVFEITDLQLDFL